MHELRLASGVRPQSGRRNLSSMPGDVWVFFITPDANGIHGEPEITGLPIFDREITLENSHWRSCGYFRRLTRLRFSNRLSY
jgi:hypothetical protein